MRRMKRIIPYKIIYLFTITYIIVCFSFITKVLQAEEPSETVGGIIEGTEITWTLSDGELVLQGKGRLPDYTSPDQLPWYSYATEITSIDIQDGITYLGERSINRLPRLLHVRLAESVSYVGIYSFYDCPNLVKVEYNSGEWPNGLEGVITDTYTNRIFYYCPKAVFVFTKCRFEKLFLTEYNIFSSEKDSEIQKELIMDGAFNGEAQSITHPLLEQAKVEDALILYSTNELTVDNFYKGSEQIPVSPAIGTREYYYFIVYPRRSQYTRGKIICNIKPVVSYDENALTWEYDGTAHPITVTADGSSIYYAVNKELNDSNYKTEGGKLPPQITDVGTYTVYYYAVPNQYAESGSCVSGKLAVTVTQKEQENIVIEPDKPAQTEDTPASDQQEGTDSKEVSDQQEIVKKPVLQIDENTYYSADQKKCRLIYQYTGDGKLTFSTSSTAVAAIDNKGKLTIKKPGIVKIKIRSTSTRQYSSATTSANLIIHPGSVKSAKVKLVQDIYTRFEWTKVSSASGYQIQFSTNAKYKKNTKTFYIKKGNQTVCYVKGNLKNSRYHIRIRAYKIVKKKKIYGKWKKIQ